MVKEKVKKIKIFKNGGVAGSSSDGSSGGIVVFWNQNNIRGEVVEVNLNFLSIKFIHLKSNFEWVNTNIYATNTKAGRAKYWKLVENHRLSFCDSPWLVMGDFNYPLKDNEKFGGVDS